jgi:hypothetical protein
MHSCEPTYASYPMLSATAQKHQTLHLKNMQCVLHPGGHKLPMLDNNV